VLNLARPSSIASFRAGARRHPRIFTLEHDRPASRLKDAQAVASCAKDSQPQGNIDRSCNPGILLERFSADTLVHNERKHRSSLELAGTSSRSSFGKAARPSAREIFMAGRGQPMSRGPIKNSTAPYISHREAANVPRARATLGETPLGGFSMRGNNGAG